MTGFFIMYIFHKFHCLLLCFALFFVIYKNNYRRSEMKKILVLLSMAFLSNAFADQSVKLVTTLQDGKISVNGNECKTVNYFYREYFNPSKEQLQEAKQAIRYDGAIEHEIEAPTTIQATGDALLFAIAEFIPQDAELAYHAPTKTCTFIAQDSRYKN